MSHNTTSQSGAGALISVRFVVADFYQADPIQGLDPLVSDFSGYDIRKVPIIRVFGCTAAGQKSCLHIHGIFPYIYVPFPSGETDGFVYRLAASLDKAINISLQQVKSGVQHVYKAVKVTGTPMYGYHPRQHTFVKIYFYNPHVVKRAAELLGGGAVMNKLLQPHESHTNYILQFMMDYNLQGMNLIHLSHALFRQGRIHDEYEEMEPILKLPWRNKKRNSSTDSDNSVNTSSADSNVSISVVTSKYLSVAPHQRYFDVDSMEECLKMPSVVSRQSTSELELDCVAPDIINHQDVTNTAMNPGLSSLWEDERQRRSQRGIADPLTTPESPPRSPAASVKSDSELFWYERLSGVIDTRSQSPDTDTTVTTDNTADPDATVVMDKKLRPHVYAAESSDHDLTILPGATKLESHVPSLSSDNTLSLQSSKLSSDISAYADETIVDEHMILTQLEEDEDSDSDYVDDELVDLLADLATDAQEGTSQEIFKTPKSSKSQRQSQGHSSSKKTRRALHDEEDDRETLEMSQAVWDTDDTDDNWAELDSTLMENFARDLTSDIEEL